MPVSCVVGGCTRNKVKNPEVYWLTFPKDVATQRAWVRFVKNTRSDFTLTSASILCSAHFSDECVDETVKMKESLGLPFRFKLKVGSVPSIKAPTVQQRPSTPSVPSTTTASSSTTPDAVQCSDEPSPSTGQTAGDPRKRSGGAYLKRERARVGKILYFVCQILHEIGKVLCWVFYLLNLQKKSMWVVIQKVNCKSAGQLTKSNLLIVSSDHGGRPSYGRGRKCY